MKKFVVAFVAIALVVAAYFSISGNSDLPEGAPNVRAAAVFEKSGCVFCHAKNTPLPFYAKIPLVNIPIQNDVREGLRGFDISQARNPAEVSDVPAIEKMKSVLQAGTMPPLGFRLVHWKSRITEREREAVFEHFNAQKKPTAAPAEQTK